MAGRNPDRPQLAFPIGAQINYFLPEHILPLISEL
jgi:hypothetical protein